MRIQRPKLIRARIRRQVAVGEKVIVRGSLVYKLPPMPTWINGNGKVHLNWLEKLIDGLIHRGWFKDSDIYVRVDPQKVSPGRPLAYIIPSSRDDIAWIMPGEEAKQLLEDARILPRFSEGALFVKTSP